MAEALLAQERHDYEQKLRDMELAQLQDLMRGPALSVQSGGGGVGSVRSQAGASSRGYSGEWSAGEEGYYEEGDVHWRGGDAGGGVTAPIALQAATVAAPALNDGTAKASSFATITQVRNSYLFSFFSSALTLDIWWFCTADGWKLPHAGPDHKRTTSSGQWRGEDGLGQCGGGTCCTCFQSPRQ
jgi:hypothetical protein